MQEKQGTLPMIKNVSWLITLRYIIGSRTDRNISIMLFICFAGIFIGAFSLALIISVMNGFESATYEKLQSIHAQIIMRADSQKLDTEKIGKVLESEFPEVAAYSPSTTKQVIIQPPHSDDISNVIAIKAIDPAREQTTSSIAKKIIASYDNTNQLTTSVTDSGSILIGNKLAQALNLSPGDTVRLMFIQEDKVKGKKVSLSEHEARIGGIFSTGIEEFDSAMGLATFPFIKAMFPDTGATQINLLLKPASDEAAIIEKLQYRFGLELFSWKDLYPALVSALKLEKYAMFLILSLITLVASMNIISLLFMYIIKKRPDIAIYKAMGMSEKTIFAIFLSIGMSIACVATLLGLAAAYGAALLLQHYPFITLPDTYYVTHLPAEVHFSSFILIFILVMLMSFIATAIPVWRIRRINISEILRYEA